MTRRDFLSLTGLIFAAHSFGWDPFRARRAESKLEFHFEPMIDLYCFLRAEIAGYSQLKGDWIGPLEKMRQASRLLPSRVSFSILDGFISDSPSLEALQKRAEAAPAYGPQDIPVRQPLMLVSSALADAMPAYTREFEPSHREAVAAARRRIDGELAPHADEAIEFLLSGLRLRDTGRPVPVYLVKKGPPPGGFTSRSRRAGAVCFVQSEGFRDSLLHEVILHEATHAFEVIGQGSEESVMDMIRTELTKRGKGLGDPLHRDVPHTLMFVHSGEAVRRFIDPKHRDYGETNGYYGRLERVSAAVRTNWLEHLKSHRPIEAVVASIVEAVVA